MIIFLIFIPFATNVFGLTDLNFMQEQNIASHIVNINSYERWNEEKIKISHEKEHYNFNQQPIRLLFHEEPGIITIYDKTRVTGFFGEIWTFLSEYANFTLVLKAVYEKRIGIRRSLTSNYNGLLRYIEQEEADVITRIEVYEYWTDVIDYLLPLWNDRYTVFAQLSYRENSFWVVHLFTPGVFIVGFIIYTLFFILTVAKNIFMTSVDNKIQKMDYSEILLYYHGIFSQRSSYLIQFQNSSRILNITVCFYSMIILSFFNANILYLVMNKTPFEPFDGLDTLYSKTNYSVISEKDSLIHLAYEFLSIYESEGLDNPLRNLSRSGRVLFFPSRARMYHQACIMDKYAILESEYLKVPVSSQKCKWEPIKQKYYHNWVASAIKKNFTYRRTIDRGILKLFESGLMNGLKNRLVGLEQIDYSQNVEPINMNQISGLLGTFLFLSSLSILMLVEEITVHRLRKYRLRKKVTGKK